jgi:hypothetical protein
LPQRTAPRFFLSIPLRRKAVSNQNDHPTVERYRERQASTAIQAPIPRLGALELREMCLACGADDVGIVEIDRPRWHFSTHSYGA